MAGLYLEGQQFGRLTVKHFHGYTKNASKLWLCECECGNTTVVSTHRLVSGHTKSCGCLHKDLLKLRLTTHGGTKDRLFNVWWDVKRRCEKEYDKNFNQYGGRNIQICDEWKDYAVFRKWAINNGYDEYAKYGECTLDRIDVNGNYCPENCRWISMKEQRFNCQNTVYVEINGNKYTLLQLSEMYNLPRKILYGRIVQLKWPVEKALNTPYEKRRSKTVRIV